MLALAETCHDPRFEMKLLAPMKQQELRLLVVQELTVLGVLCVWLLGLRQDLVPGASLHLWKLPYKNFHSTKYRNRVCKGKLKFGPQSMTAEVDCSAIKFEQQRQLSYPFC